MPLDRLSRRSFVRAAGAGAAGSLLAPWISGRGLEAAALGSRLAGMELDLATPPKSTAIRLDSNENPNGPGKAALDAVRAALGGSSRYPDDAVSALRAQVAAGFGVTPDQVALDCGSTDILRASVYAFASPARALVTASPAYEDPVRDAERVGAPVRAIPVRADDLRLDLDAMAGAVRAEGAPTGLVYLCNPNNPTSTVHGAEAVKEFVARVAAASPETTILVDEAYHDYVDDPRYATAVPLALESPRVLIVRTFSKVYGMAGLRVGYAIGQPATIKAVARHTLALGVNALGAAAAAAAFGVREHVERERTLNREARAFTVRAFADLGCRSAESQANFVLVNLGRDAKPFRDACRRNGVLVGRPFPPLDQYARITIGTMDEMRRATEVFRTVLATT